MDFRFQGFEYWTYQKKYLKKYLIISWSRFLLYGYLAFSIFKLKLGEFSPEVYTIQFDLKPKYWSETLQILFTKLSPQQGNAAWYFTKETKETPILLITTSLYSH